MTYAPVHYQIAGDQPPLAIADQHYAGLDNRAAAGVVMSCYAAGNSGAYNTTLTAAPFDTVEYQRSTFNASLAGNLITISEAVPSLLVEFDVSIEHTGGGTRAVFVHRVVHGGSGPGLINNSGALSYIRSQAATGTPDGTTASGWCVLNIASGDTVGVSSIRSASTGTARMVANGCRMRLSRLPA